MENASDSDKNSKSATKKLAEKVERFKQSRKSHSETRIVGGVAINTVGNNTPLSVQSSAVSVKSESELDNIQNKVLHLFFYHFLSFWLSYSTFLLLSSFIMSDCTIPSSHTRSQSSRSLPQNRLSPFFPRFLPNEYY